MGCLPDRSMMRRRRVAISALQDRKKAGSQEWLCRLRIARADRPLQRPARARFQPQAKRGIHAP